MRGYTMEAQEPFALPGFRIGHWTHPSGQTGCSVVIAEDGLALAVVDVRGGAPGTRETDLLQRGALVQRVDAVLLTGGSAFGLAATEGVVQWLREQGRGFPTTALPVPIVAAAVLYDLVPGNLLWPDAAAGYAAAVAARPDGWQSGRLGAGAGATVAKLLDPAMAQPSGLGAARIDLPEGSIAVLVAVNAVGMIVDPATGQPIAAPRDQDGNPIDLRRAFLRQPPRVQPLEQTTIAVVATTIPADTELLTRMAIAAHDGIARTIWPAHTVVDGDTVFVLAAQPGSPELFTRIRAAVATECAMERAILASVKHG